jgi:hypothetical protein
VTFEAAPATPVGPVGPTTGETTKFQETPVHTQVEVPSVNVSFTKGVFGKSIAAIIYS